VIEAAMSHPCRIGEHVYLRPVEPSDNDRFVRWINDPLINQFILSGRFPVNTSKEMSWIEGLYKDDSRAVFAICLTDNDLHIGVCGMDTISWVDRATSAGIFIGERSLHGKGHGTEAMKLLVCHAFETLNLNRVELGVYEHNTAARRSYEKLGFTVEGTKRQARFANGQYRDELIMAVLRDEWDPK